MITLNGRLHDGSDSYGVPPNTPPVGTCLKFAELEAEMIEGGGQTMRHLIVHSARLSSVHSARDTAAQECSSGYYRTRRVDTFS